MDPIGEPKDAAGTDDEHPMVSDGKPTDVKRPKGGKGKGGGPGAQALQVLRRAEASGWTATINLNSRMAKAGARTDAEIADRMLDDVLAIRAPDDTRARMRAFLAHEREDLKVPDGKLLEGAGSERVLRRLAHLILSLPEAQLE